MFTVASSINSKQMIKQDNPVKRYYLCKIPILTQNLLDR